MPEISVIIPTLNRSLHLIRCLNTIAIQTIDPVIFELIVIDNGSTDSTVEEVDYFSRKNPHLSVKYFFDPEPGLLTGRHRGAAEAVGKYFVFIDDDVELSPKWLESIYTQFTNNPDVRFITGPCFPLYENYPPGWLKYFWNTNGSVRSLGYLSLVDMGAKLRSIKPTSVWGLNFGIRKDTFYELMGFHPDCISDDLQKFQGDGELGLTKKALKLHYKAIYLPEASVYHLVPEKRLTEAYFEKRAFYQGVSDSFSQLKEQNEIQIKLIKPKISINKIVWRLKHLWAWLFDKQNFNEYRRIKKKCVVKYKAGYSFHKKSLNEPGVSIWVSKMDYLDYKLPLYK